MEPKKKKPSARRNTYAGESYAKKAVRGELYLRAIKLQRAFKVSKRGRYLTLTGPEAAEVPILQLIAPNDALFVDLDSTCNARVRQRWPNVETFDGSVGDALAQLDRRGELISFAHFDFMGHLSESTLSVARQVGRLLNPPTLIAFTFLRGRENFYGDGFKRARKARNRFITKEMRDACTRNRALDRALTRRYGYIELILDAVFDNPPPLERGEFTMMSDFVYEYHSGVSPMMTVSYAVEPMFSEKCGEWHSPPHDFANHVTVLTRTKEQLRDRVLAHLGEESDEVLAAAFNIPRGTLAAWKAHATRGTYVEAPSGVRSP